MNRKDHIMLDEASKHLSSDKIIISGGEEEYVKGMKIIFKMLGVTTRRKGEKQDKDPFELMKSSMGKLVGL